MVQISENLQNRLVFLFTNCRNWSIIKKYVDPVAGCGAVFLHLTRWQYHVALCRIVENLPLFQTNEKARRRLFMFFSESDVTEFIEDNDVKLELKKLLE